MAGTDITGSTPDEPMGVPAEARESAIERANIDDPATIARVKGKRLLAKRRRRNALRRQEAIEFTRQRNQARERYAESQRRRSEEWERQRREASERSLGDRIRWAVVQKGGSVPPKMSDEERERAAAHARAVWKREQTAEIKARMREICSMPYHEDPSLSEEGSPLSRVTPRRMAIISHLLDISADTSTVWAAQETVARASGTSRSTVVAIMKELEAAGVLRRIRTGGRNMSTGRTSSSVYHLHQQRLRELLGIPLRGESRYALPARNKMSIGLARAEVAARCAASGHPIPENPFYSEDGMSTGRRKTAGFRFNSYRRCWWNITPDLHFQTLSLTTKRRLEKRKGLIQVCGVPGGAGSAARAARRQEREAAMRERMETEAFLSSWPNPTSRTEYAPECPSEPSTPHQTSDTGSYDSDPQWLRTLALLDRKLADELVDIATPMTVDEWNNLDASMKSANGPLDVHARAAELVTMAITLK